MDKYGFVYIWYDRKHKRYYIGRHWGFETDKYICSSRWMRKSYRRRPSDFKRRILSKVYKKELIIDEELKWLSFIKDDELGKRYYNLRKHGYSGNIECSLEMKMKISETKKEIGIPKEQQEKMINARINSPNGGMKGKNHSEKTKLLFSKIRKGKQLGELHPRYKKHHTEESKQKISESLLGNVPWNKGIILSEEIRKKMSETRKGKKRGSYKKKQVNQGNI